MVSVTPEGHLFKGIHLKLFHNRWKVPHSNFNVNVLSCFPRPMSDSVTQSWWPHLSAFLLQWSPTKVSRLQYFQNRVTSSDYIWELAFLVNRGTSDPPPCWLLDLISRAFRFSFCSYEPAASQISLSECLWWMWKSWKAQEIDPAGRSSNKTDSWWETAVIHIFNECIYVSFYVQYLYEWRMCIGAISFLFFIDSPTNPPPSWRRRRRRRRHSCSLQPFFYLEVDGEMVAWWPLFPWQLC